MKITSLTLNNFQSYANETIEFDDGVSLLHGDNGSGKSTVLRGIFAGLFQTKMRSHSATQFNSIADLVRKGESEGSVSLTFDVNRTEYTLDWEISVDDPSADEPTGSSESCTLSSPALASPISGITPVRTALTEDILGMDAEAFVNSVYVQQNEVMKLISATESERKKIFDDLLGLSQIDEYIDRTSEVRLGADDKREAAANRRDELQRQLEDDYPDREELEERQRELNSQLRDAKQKRDDLTGKRSDRHDEWEDFDDRIENYGDLEDEQEDLEDDIVTLSAKIDNVREEISTLEDESDDARGEMWEIKGEINEIDGEIDQYDLSESEAAAATEDEANDEFVSANRNETSAASEVESARDDLNEATEEKRDLEEDLANCRDDLREVQKTLETAQERVNEFETALNDAHENRNDTVTSYLPSSPSPDEITQETRSTVEDHIASLDDEREDRRNDLTRVNADLSNAREAVTQLKERVEDASEDRDDVLAALPDDLQTETGASDGGIVATRVDDAEETIEALETVSIEIDFQIRSSIETARDSTIPEARSELDSRYAEVVDTYADLSGQELHLEKRLSEYTQIKRSGNCPVCGEAVADDNDHHIGERDATNDELVEVQCELVDVREERQTLEADQERLDTLRGLVSEILLLSTLHETESKLERLQSDLAEKRGEVETLQEEVGTIGDEVSELTAIVDEGRETILPTFETVETRLDELSDAEETVEEADADYEEIETECTDLEDRIEETDERINTCESNLATAKDDREAAQETVAAAEETLELVRKAISLHDRHTECERTIETNEEAIGNKEDVLSSKREQRGEKESRLQEVTEELNQADLDDLRDERAQVAEAIDSLDNQIESAQETVDSTNRKLSDVEGQLDTIQRLGNRINHLDDCVTKAAGVVKEMESVESMYEDVKARLRQQNIKLINAHANEVFRDIYHSQSYERLILNEDYTLRLLKSDGSQISPKLSSGGESAIANIALRAGIYRTIIERNQTLASGLPPFILDEPTTFLDSGHIQELEAAIKNIKSWNVAQVLIVSHDETLIDSADFEYRVKKDAATDKSSCERQTPAASTP